MVWAFTAKVDQTISVRGRLQPAGSVNEVDSPSNGVVRKVLVKEGQLVEAGQPLLDVEAKGLASRRQAIEQTLQILGLQAKSLDTVIATDGDISKMAPLPDLPPVADPSLASTLATARNQTLQIKAQLQQIETRLVSRRQSLSLKQRIAEDIRPLYESGAMARNAYLGQVNEVQELKAEIATLREEKVRVIGAATTQLNDINRQRINLQSELVGLKETISYRTIHAPISGRVFDSKVSPFAVVSTDQILLKIVPENALQAVVEIPNADVGFVKVGMPVSVSVDSFPAGEFGYINGTLTKLGSDALKPDQLSPQYRFPGVVSLKQQIVQSGDQKLNLQSGMSVTANIKLRTRPAITIVTDLFTKQFEGLKTFR
jgi:hemolysin D